jgi:hypothetical protein
MGGWTRGNGAHVGYDHGDELEGDQRDQEKVAARESWDDGRAQRHDPPHDRWSLGKIWALEPGGVPGRLWAGTMLLTCSVRRRSKRELRSSRPDG